MRRRRRIRRTDDGLAEARRALALAVYPLRLADDPITPEREDELRERIENGDRAELRRIARDIWPPALALLDG